MRAKINYCTLQGSLTTKTMLACAGNGNRNGPSNGMPSADAEAMDAAAAMDMERLQHELQAVEAKLQRLGALPTAPQDVPVGLVDALSCRFLLVELPLNSLVALAATSRAAKHLLSTSACWRGLYSAAFPHELSSREALAEARHPLPASMWQKLFVERQLDGPATVPCFLHNASTMASATLDPSAVRLIEAYLRRLTQTVASMHSAILSPPDDPGPREAALAECARLIDACEVPAVRASKMVLRQLQNNNHAFGCDGSTIWAYEQETTQLRAAYQKLASTQALYKRFITTATDTISGAQTALGAAGGAATAVQPPADAHVGTLHEPPPPPHAPLAPGLRLQVGATVEAIREAGDDEWERATVLAIEMATGTVSLVFEDRYRAPRVPLERIRQATESDGAPSDKTDTRTAVEATAQTAAQTAGGDAPAREYVPTLVRKRVRIDGLVGRPELNGTYGLAISYDAKAGRYAIRPEAEGSARVALRPDNLSRADGWGEHTAPAAAKSSQSSTPASTRKAAPLPSQAEARAMYDRLFAERAAGLSRAAPLPSTEDAEEDFGARVVDVTDEV